MNIPPPLERLLYFKEKLGIDDNDFSRLGLLSGIAQLEKEAFSSWLYDYFFEIPHTRAVLEHETYDDRLKRTWADWFSSLFDVRDQQKFVTRHWKSGLKHVQSGVDHRYVNMAYGLVRRYIGRMVLEHRDIEDSEGLLKIIDKVLDLCILIETDAFITSTTQCDHEVIKGIAHQVRNPLTVIGGNLMLLQKKTPGQDPRKKIYDTMLLEASRLERMVKNVVTYNEVFQREPEPVKCLVRAFLQDAIDLIAPQKLKGKVDIDLDESCPEVSADQNDFKAILFHLLQNAYEAVVDSKNPLIKINSHLNPSITGYLDIEIFNNGDLPRPDDIDQMFTPFFSTKSMGTGFGLPIVKLAARKNNGNFKISLVPDQGVLCVVTLPC